MAQKINLRALLILALFLLMPMAANGARIIYVDANATGASDGSSWADAYNFLQDALGDANSSGDVNEIRVAQGLYKPDQNSANPDGNGDREATFQLINDVALKGGYAGYDQSDPNARDVELYETILSGDLDGNDVDVNSPEDLWEEPTRAENSYHVVTGSGTDTTAVLDGFTITGGNANDGPWTDPTCRGGGMYNYQGSPTVTSCTLRKNHAFDCGGGMCNDYCSSPTVTHCTFSGNFALWGGGMSNDWCLCNPTVTNCTFSGNGAMGGAGMDNYGSNPTVTNCTFSGNEAREGGGMCNHSSRPTVTNCTFSGNAVVWEGGGMCNYYGSSPTLGNCTFIGNSSYWLGGGIGNRDSSEPTLTNCSFSGNSADVGGGMADYSYGRAMLTNCSFSGNFAYTRGGGMCSYSYPTLTNCIFSGNSTICPTFGLPSFGGGIYCSRSPTIFNCVISGNTSVKGGGIACSSTGKPNIINCTLRGNSAESGGGIYNDYGGTTGPTLTNCVLWGNVDNSGMGQQAQIRGATPRVDYCCVQGWTGSLGGVGNFGDDPCFVSAPAGYCLLLPGSPCIDTGDNNSVPADVHDLDGDGNTAEPIPWDLEGNPRIMDGDNDGNSVVDMGAYEANYVQVQMKFTPQALNPGSQGKWFKLHFVLPEGYGVEDVDVSKPALCKLMDTDGVAESNDMSVFVNKEGLVEIEAFFDRGALSLCRNGQAERNVTILGLLAGTGGQCFYGTDTIKIINKTWEHLAGLTLHWLEEGCGEPDWCGGQDLNQDGAVDFVDLALFDGCCIEVITE